jgi:hypothetical protein
MANFYCTTCHNLNHPNIKIKRRGLFQNNKDIFLIIKKLGHMATHNLFPCSPKKSHSSCKRQYVHDKSKDEGVFC